MTQVIKFDGNAAQSRAIELAHKAGHSIDTALNTIADAKQEMTGGAVRVMIALRDTFGDELDGFPKPGEKEGNNRDVLTVEKTVNGETKSVNTTFYTVLADNLPPGIDIMTRLEMCERAKKTDTIKDDIPADILEMARTKTIQREIDRLTGRRGTFRQSIKRAMELVHQFTAIENVPNVRALPIWEDGKEGEDVIPSPKCIVVWQPGGVDDKGEQLPIKYSADVTVTTFLKYKADKAIEAGGGFKALEDTLAKGKKASNAEAGTASDRRIASLDTMIGVVTELHRYVDEITYNKDQADYNRLIKGLKSKQASDEVISSFVELRDYLNDIIGATDMEDRQKEIVAKVAKAA